MDPKEYGAMVQNYAACGAIATAISVSKDVGILDVLYNSEVPLTSQQIADKGDLKERYVRELLGALVTGKVVQTDESSSTFVIKTELKPALKSTAVFTRYPVYFGEKYQAIMNCVAKDGPAGVRYSEYPAIFDIMDEVQAVTQDSLIECDILASHPPLADKLKSGMDVLEIGSANGTVILNLCKRFPKSRFTGSDVVESVIDIARKKSQERGLTNSKFTIVDVCDVPQSAEKQYDWIFTRDVIHDLPKPQEAIKGVYRMLKPGGVFTMIDIVMDGSLFQNVGNVGAGFFFTAGTFVCIPESFQGGDSTALGPCWPVEMARGMITKAGFTLLSEHRCEANKSEATFVCLKPE